MVPHLLLRSPIVGGRVSFAMPKTRTVFFDAWHTLFTVRAHGPERLATALRALDLTANAVAASAFSAL